MGVMLIIARIDWLTCKRKGCGWCFSSSTRWCFSRPAWFKTADRTWSFSGAEVRRELKKRMSGWAVVTNDEACRALPEMKDLCIAIQYTPGVCCFLWVPVVIYTPFFLMMSVVFNTLSLDWSWCQQFFGSHSCDPVQFPVTLSTKDFPHHSAVQNLFILCETCSELIDPLFPRHISVCDVVLKNKPHFSKRKLARSTWLWEEHFLWCDRKIHFLFSSRLLSLCTVEEPRVPTLEVTLITSCWLTPMFLFAQL